MIDERLLIDNMKMEKEKALEEKDYYKSRGCNDALVIIDKLAAENKVESSPCVANDVPYHEYERVCREKEQLETVVLRMIMDKFEMPYIR